jgi:hypothetical protein
VPTDPPATASDPAGVPSPEPAENGSRQPEAELLREQTPWPVGTVVRLLQRPSYLKTADPMPMLRPPDLIGVDETGQVVEQRPLGQLAVRFRRGTFLLAASACAPVSD